MALNTIKNNLPKNTLNCVNLGKIFWLSEALGFDFLFRPHVVAINRLLKITY